MDHTILLAEAQRLLKLYDASPGKFLSSGLPDTWRERMSAILKSNNSDALLPVMSEFVMNANKALNLDEAVSMGINLAPAPVHGFGYVEKATVVNNTGNLPDNTSTTNPQNDQNTTTTQTQNNNDIPVLLGRLLENIDTKISGFKNTADRLSDSHSFLDSDEPCDCSKHPEHVMESSDSGQVPKSIDGYDALDANNFDWKCTPPSERKCSGWKRFTHRWRMDNIDEIRVKIEVEKIPIPNNRIRIRITATVTRINERNGYIVYDYKVCCCRWFWGKFRWPGDCRSMYKKIKEGITVVPETPTVDVIFDEVHTDWGEELYDFIKELVNNAMKGAGSELGKLAGGAKELVDPIVEKIKEWEKNKLGGGAGSGGGSGK